MFKISEIANQELIEKFIAPGPYYTSYPTLGAWSANVQEHEYVEALSKWSQRENDKQVALYIHFPYCPQQCYFCICNVTITKDRQKINTFLQYMLTEIDMLFSQLGKNGDMPSFQAIHFGGGTPSYLTEEEIISLVEKLNSWIDVRQLKEFSIEFDPRSATPEKFRLAHELGFNRLSMGIQDFKLEVQQAVNRVHSFEMIDSLLTSEVRSYFNSINFDLLYGLPLQTRDSFHETIELIKKLSPDRITLLKYAHVPNINKHMKVLDNYPTLNDEEKAWMFFEAMDNFKSNGWNHIGIDHFAKPTDSLTKAMKNRTMKREFIGFSSHGCDTLFGIGPSSTLKTSYAYYQNTCNLETYANSISKGRFPIQKSYRMSSDDLVRREIIESILCEDRVGLKKVEAKYQIDFNSYFSEEIQGLQHFVQDEMVEFTSGDIQITPLGKIFNRHICKEFDRFLRNKHYEIHGTGNKNHL